MADKKVEAKKADAKKADAKKPAKKNKQNVFQKLFKYLSACKGELKKITWPSPKQTTKELRYCYRRNCSCGTVHFRP